MDWAKLPLCDCIKILLKESGYDCALSLENMNEDRLFELEDYVQKYLRKILTELTCSHSETYLNISKEKFNFLPGHRKLILNLKSTFCTKRTSTLSKPVMAPNLAPKLMHLKVILEEIKNTPAFSELLIEIMDQAIKNYSTTQNNNRYSEFIKYFTLYLYLLCGQKSYEILCANLPFPSITTIRRYLQNFKLKITEGLLRCTELRSYLQKIGAPLTVWLSEDASGIVQRVVYDVSSNKLIGLNLPINEFTGMPITSTYLATSLPTIESHMKNPKSSLVYIVMAQPVKVDSPPFLLQIFGTNNKFSNLDVTNRWKHTIAELNKVGIQVLGISADGDYRLLGAMRRDMILDLNILDPNVYSILSARDRMYLQDPTHIGTKLRNRLLKPSISLPFGTKAISASHLKVLLANCPKDIHGLVMSDISPQDRQNFKSVQKLMETRVTDSLKCYVIDSEATIVYINICKNATSCCLDEQLTPLERIYRVWNATFLLRIWRQFILQSNDYNLEDNFVTHNAQACIELNAICLIQLIIYLRDIGKPEMFQPHLFDSQPCERTFRQMRSMTTQNWIKINFTLAELLHLIERTELQNDIAFYKLADVMEFPRVKIDRFNLGGRTSYEMPSNDEIINTIRSALTDAMQCASEFGMHFENMSDITTCPLRNLVDYRNQNLTCDEDEDYNDFDDCGLNNRDESLNLRDYSDKQLVLGENSKYIEIREEDGTTKIVLKSSLIWLLSDSVDKLSNDRLKRVQSRAPQESAKRRKLTLPHLSEFLTKSIEICIGQWCVFNSVTSDASMDESVFKNVLFGSVLAFRNVNGKTKKEKQYYSDFITVLDDAQNKRQDIEVLAVWYVLRSDGTLVSLSTNSSFYINIKNYVATTTQPTVVKNGNVTILSLKNISQNKESFLEFINVN